MKISGSLHRLGEVSPGDELRIGRKAANLNRLLQQGFPVPPGICIPIDAFLAAIAPFEQLIAPLLEGVTSDDPTQALSLSRRISMILEGLALPADLSEEIQHALLPFESELFAVRSSASLEDLAGASFAGQYSSILGVLTRQEIEKAILECWRSYFSPNALAARARYQARVGNRLAAGGHGMAVLIQPLIDADCSGVCFSVDPVHLRAEHILVTSTWGLGIGVVSGTIPSDTSIVHRSDLSIEHVSITDKPECIRFSHGKGLQRVANLEEQRRIACLTDPWLQRVAQFGLAIEQVLGFPQDVEWAIAGQQVWVLQSRPITTLPAELVTSVTFPIEWANEAEPHHLWWLWNLHDWPRACLLPIESEFINLRTAGGHAAVEYGGGEKTRWTKFVNGRAFIAVADSPLSPADRHIRAAAKNDLLERLQQQDITQWEYWGPEIVRATERLAGFDPQGASGQSLADHIEDTMAVARRHWMVHTLIPRRGNLKSLVDAYQTMTGKNGLEVDRDIQFLIQGEETIQTRLVEALFDLALLVQQAPPVAALVSNHPPDVLTHLYQMPGARPFLDKLEQFMMIYGSRLCYRRKNDCANSLPSTWQEAPEYVLEMIAAYLPKALDQEVPSPREGRERAEKEHQSRLEALYTKTQDPTAVKEFRRRLAYARRNAAFTDEHNHYIDQLADGQFIQAAIYAGRWLAVRGDLDQPDDVYWLHSEEILAALRSPEKQDLNKLAGERKDQFTAWSQLVAPISLGLPNSQLPERIEEVTPRMLEQVNEAALTHAAKNVLAGKACSLGSGQGRARLLTESDSLPEISPGDVLVAKNAGPLWTPVIGILAGIVLDEGDAGAHVAITAREFGIPAVFGVVSATWRIPEGVWVTVDGTNGVVAWDDGE